jgi:mono/diheme cytochrome c family protein
LIGGDDVTGCAPAARQALAVGGIAGSGEGVGSEDRGRSQSAANNARKLPNHTVSFVLVAGRCRSIQSLWPGARFAIDQGRDFVERGSLAATDPPAQLKAPARNVAGQQEHQRQGRSMNRFWLPLLAALWSSTVLAADANRGRDIAQQQCAACHIVTPGGRNELADSPPFDLIGRKNGFDASALAFSLLGPHPKMNFALSQRDAEDVAAYIGTLAR